MQLSSQFALHSLLHVPTHTLSHVPPHPIQVVSQPLQLRSVGLVFNMPTQEDVHDPEQ